MHVKDLLIFFLWQIFSQCQQTKASHNAQLVKQWNFETFLFPLDLNKCPLRPHHKTKGTFMNKTLMKSYFCFLFCRISLKICVFYCFRSSVAVGGSNRVTLANVTDAICQKSLPTKNCSRKRPIQRQFFLLRKYFAWYIF